MKALYRSFFVLNKEKAGKPASFFLHVEELKSSSLCRLLADACIHLREDSIFIRLVSLMLSRCSSYAATGRHAKPCIFACAYARQLVLCRYTLFNAGSRHLEGQYTGPLFLAHSAKNIFNYSMIWSIKFNLFCRSAKLPNESWFLLRSAKFLFAHRFLVW